MIQGEESDIVTKEHIDSMAKRKEERENRIGTKKVEKEKSNLTIKGDLIKSSFITSTMGVSYKLKLSKNF